MWYWSEERAGAYRMHGAEIQVVKESENCSDCYDSSMKHHQRDRMIVIEGASTSVPLLAMEEEKCSWGQDRGPVVAPNLGAEKNARRSLA